MTIGELRDKARLYLIRELVEMRSKLKHDEMTAAVESYRTSLASMSLEEVIADQLPPEVAVAELEF